MIVVCLWAVIDAVAAWVMRDDFFTGTPEQIRQQTDQAFLELNFLLGFVVVWLLLFLWLERVYWFNRTGGLVPFQAFTTCLLSMQEWRSASTKVALVAGIGVGVVLALDRVLPWAFQYRLPLVLAFAADTILPLAVFAMLACSVRRR